MVVVIWWKKSEWETNESQEAKQVSPSSLSSSPGMGASTCNMPETGSMQWSGQEREERGAGGCGCKLLEASRSRVGDGGVGAGKARTRRVGMGGGGGRGSWHTSVSPPGVFVGAAIAFECKRDSHCCRLILLPPPTHNYPPSHPLTSFQRPPTSCCVINGLSSSTKTISVRWHSFGPWYTVEEGRQSYCSISTRLSARTEHARNDVIHIFIIIVTQRFKFLNRNKHCEFFFREMKMRNPVHVWVNEWVYEWTKNKGNHADVCSDTLNINLFFIVRHKYFSGDSVFPYLHSLSM